MGDPKSIELSLMLSMNACPPYISTHVPYRRSVNPSQRSGIRSGANEGSEVVTTTNNHILHNKSNDRFIIIFKQHTGRFFRTETVPVYRIHETIVVVDDEVNSPDTF